MALTELNGTRGFTAGDLNTNGYFAAIAAYQKIYFADGRDDGYHKLDMINTVITGTASGALTQGEIVTQATSGAKGVFDETVGSGGTAKHFIYRLSDTEFDDSNTITGGTSSETISPSAVLAPPYWLDWTETSGKEGLPSSGANAGCLCFGRIFLNSMESPNQWFASRQGDPNDWLVSQNDLGSAVSSQTSKAGKVGGEIVGFIPCSPYYLVFGCIGSMHLLRGDPVAGGSMSDLTLETGLASPNSYCYDDKFNLYFMGLDGIYYADAATIINSAPPINITRFKTPHLFKEIALSRRTDRVSMGYDKDRYGILIAITQRDGDWATNFWLDLRTGSVVEEGANLFPEVYNDDHKIHSIYYHNSPDSTKRKLLIGCDDGYVRNFDESVKNDDGETIESFFVSGPFVSDDIRGAVMHKSTSVELGSDSDSVAFKIYAEKTAMEVIKSIANGDDARLSRSLSSANLNRAIQQKMRNGSLAFKIGNTSSGESFSIERIITNIQKLGRLK